MGKRKDRWTFCAELEGENEVPPVETKAEGFALARVIHEGKALQVKVFVEKIKNVVSAHIHLGRPGENGPVVAFLFGPSEPVSIRKESLLACRTITSGDLVGPLQGQPLARLIEEIKAGNAYVNVHTVQNPDGEIRGQLEMC